MNTANAFKPLTKDDIAVCLNVSLRTVENWVGDGTLPSPKKLGNRVYWHPDVFYAWLSKRLMDEGERDVDAEAAVTQNVNRNVQSKPVKSEVDRLRAKDQAKLERLLA